MNLINEAITHTTFGEGNVVDQDASFITIRFDEKIRKFVYPDAFQKFITLNNEHTAKIMKQFMINNEAKEAALEKQREEEKEQQELERQRLDMMKNHKIHESAQIVFWLDEDKQQKTFTDWQIFTGEVQSGKNKGQPNRAPRLRPNSAVLLTERGSGQEETERRILGLYMVHELFSGDLSEDGMITSHPEFRIELSDEEAEKMLFWNYYMNKSHPNRTSWNSGKFRYFDNVWTAQILKDIIALQTDEAQINITKNFLEYFCKMNALDIDNIPGVSGALKQ